MATATVNVLGQINLIGTTPDPSSAPITYTLRGAGTSFSITPQNASSATISDIDGTRSRVTFAPNKFLIIPNESIAAVLANLNNAFPQVDRQIAQQVLVAAPTPTPPPPPAPRPAPAPVSDDLINTPALTTQPTPVTIQVPQIDDEGNVIGTTPVTLGAPPATTDPSNPLPLGDAIDDIYDPNLTPEQVASLSAEDQEVRAEVLATVGDRGFADVAEDGTIVVTAPRPSYQDWRVKLSLARESNYFYNDPDGAGILAPLRETNGVIFPYTPQISINYAANYEQSTIIHNNYKVYQYSNSSVDNIIITCEFTAQDTREANYLLAVIHFFRSATKMFFGQDQNPRAGTPPPLCYLKGMGSYQFSEHPIAITGFTYNLPTDVDYIKTVGPTISGLPLPSNPLSVTRLPDNVLPGGRPAPPDFTQIAASPEENGLVTWVPTKIQLSITAIPIISRTQMSQQFSLKEYANGSLLNVRNSPDGGFW